MTDIDCMVAAARLGLRFNGMQKYPDGSTRPMFTDVMETRSSFMVHRGETPEAALARVRDSYRNYQAPSSEAP